MDSLLDWLQVLTLIVVAVAAVSLIAFGYFRSSRQSSFELPTQTNSGREDSDGRAEFLSALRDASQEIVTDLDARVTSTRELLKEADERIATLAELLARFEQVASQHQNGEVQRQAPARRSRPAAGSSSQPEKREVQEEKNGSRGDAAKERPAHDDVRALAREGKRPEEIAKELGMGTGEVLLILGLSRRA